MIRKKIDFSNIRTNKNKPPQRTPSSTKAQQKDNNKNNLSSSS